MKENLKNTNTWVLLSGGVDSSACVAFYLERGFSVYGIFIDYGQAAAKREISASKAIANHFRIPLKTAKWAGLKKKTAGVILGRNAFLLISALMELPENAGILAIGVHSGTVYNDCSPTFIKKMQTLFDLYTKGTIQIGTPFLKWTKEDIWAFCKRKGIPTELTYSCEHGSNQPCGECLSCRDLEVLYACT